MANHLQYETSPYLRQHAQQPVNWYPWSPAAFEKARNEDKPIFLSIGYSTCHWCHVMAKESFADEDIAALLNQYYVAIKVDREERPDIDHIYMRVCEAFTGGGGWPATIFMTPDQKPFYAGTYYPKRTNRGMAGLRELLLLLHEKWETEREGLLAHADQITSLLEQETAHSAAPSDDLLKKAVQHFKETYDQENGGFGTAPKFPAPHQLLFLFSYGQRFQDESCQSMAQHTLMQICRGGICDAAGGGFSRYATDDRFLAPHFEKMLYDNAWMIQALCRGHDAVKEARLSSFFLQTAEKTAAYILLEMTSPEGGFYSAQDADSEGEEGRYYLFSWEEIKRLVPKEVFPDFCRHFGITRQGNFQGKNILNQLNSDPADRRFDAVLKALYDYRAKRHPLNRDDKILTGWNGLMIAALCALYRASGKAEYLEIAQKADTAVQKMLTQGNQLYASFAAGRRGANAFLDDYAAYAMAQLALYEAALKPEYLQKAEALCGQALGQFADRERGGFYFRADGQEDLLMRTKETYDGAQPSGNSIMAWNLVRLSLLTGKERWTAQAESQLAFLGREASAYPAGYALFLCALLAFEQLPMKVLLISDREADAAGLPFQFPSDAVLSFQKPSAAYPMLNGKVTYYICKNRQCCPPANDPQSALPHISAQ